jgi:hypothetical protein
MLNEDNQIHNFISSSGSDFLTSYGSGSGSTSQKVFFQVYRIFISKHRKERKVAGYT